MRTCNEAHITEHIHQTLRIAVKRYATAEKVQMQRKAVMKRRSYRTMSDKAVESHEPVQRESTIHVGEWCTLTSIGGRDVVGRKGGQ